MAMRTQSGFKVFLVLALMLLGTKDVSAVAVAQFCDSWPYVEFTNKLCSLAQYDHYDQIRKCLGDDICNPNSPDEPNDEQAKMGCNERLRNCKACDSKNPLRDNQWGRDIDPITRKPIQNLPQNWGTLVNCIGYPVPADRRDYRDFLDQTRARCGEMKNRLRCPAP